MWAQSSNNFFYKKNTTEIEKLPKAVYTVKEDQFIGVFLDKTYDHFNLPEKIYDLDKSFIETVVKTYNNPVLKNSNLGVLLWGVKGSGKTVTSKVIAETLNLPVLLINYLSPGIIDLLQKMEDEVVLLFDEYDKNFYNKDDKQTSNNILSIMDGFTISKKLFILTANDLRKINDFLLGRPNRIRYVKEYDDLSLPVINMIIDDLLDKELISLKNELIKKLKGLENVTLDIVKEMINEVNYHKNIECLEFFNVIEEELQEYYDVYYKKDENDENVELVSKSLYWDEDNFYKGRRFNIGKTKVVTFESFEYFDIDENDKNDQLCVNIELLEGGTLSFYLKQYLHKSFVI